MAFNFFKESLCFSHFKNCLSNNYTKSLILQAVIALMEMGFDEKEVIDALRVNNNQQDAAVSDYINNGVITISVCCFWGVPTKSLYKVPIKDKLYLPIYTLGQINIWQPQPPTLK